MGLLLMVTLFANGFMNKIKVPIVTMPQIIRFAARRLGKIDGEHR